MGQNPNSKLRIITSQKKALININNQSKTIHLAPLFKKSNTLKFQDKILIINSSVNQLIISYHQFSKTDLYFMPFLEIFNTCEKMHSQMLGMWCVFFFLKFCNFIKGIVCIYRVFLDKSRPLFSYLIYKQVYFEKKTAYALLGFFNWVSYMKI